VSSEETRDAFQDVSTSIVDAVHSVLEHTPPELVGDISESGLLLTGGGSLICGLDKLLEKQIGIGAHLAEDPITCVARGTAIALKNLENLPDGLLFIAKSKRQQ
jgi:rod shape-determining protein MreB